MKKSIQDFSDNFDINAKSFVLPAPLEKAELVEIFRKFYQKRKSKGEYGTPCFSNFRVFIKILSREFLLLHYNLIFFEIHFKRYRKTFFNLSAKLALINSKPAIKALLDQEEALKNFSE